MPASVLLGHKCSGHGCFPSRQNDQGSPNVFGNGLPVHRVSDHWVQHSCPNQGSHDSKAATGSPNTFANGLARCRIGDSVACSSTMIQGSSNIFINS